MECKVSDLVKRGHDKAAQLKSSGGAVSQLISDLATQLDVQLARSNALAAENAGLKSDQVRLFNSGYQRGHEATVEGYYVDIHQNDMTTYHEDIVAEIAEEQNPATDAFLAEVQASALEYYANLFKDTVNMDVKHNQEFHKGTLYVADQFRKGAAL